MAERITQREASRIWRLGHESGLTERAIRDQTGRARETIRRILHGRHPALALGLMIEAPTPELTTAQPPYDPKDDRCLGCGGLLTERPCRACAVRNLQRPGDPNGETLAR